MNGMKTENAERLHNFQFPKYYVKPLGFWNQTFSCLWLHECAAWTWIVSRHLNGESQKSSHIYDEEKSASRRYLKLLIPNKLFLLVENWTTCLMRFWEQRRNKTLLMTRSLLLVIRVSWKISSREIFHLNSSPNKIFITLTMIIFSFL